MIHYFSPDFKSALKTHAVDALFIVSWQANNFKKNLSRKIIEDFPTIKGVFRNKKVGDKFLVKTDYGSIFISNNRESKEDSINKELLLQHLEDCLKLHWLTNIGIVVEISKDNFNKEYKDDIKKLLMEYPGKKISVFFK